MAGEEQGKVTAEITGKFEVQNNAYSMHSGTERRKHQAHGGFWPAMGSGEGKVVEV